MKPIVNYLLVAVVASGVACGVMFFAMRRPSEAVAPVAPAPVAAVTPAATPEEVPPPPPEAPAEKPTEPERPRAAQPAKHSAMPKTVAKVNPPSQPATPDPVQTVAPPAPAPVAAAPEPHVEAPPPPPPVPERVPHVVTIPSGSLIHVRLDETLSSERNQSGDTFRAVLDQPIVIDGLVIAERGARVTGRIVDIEQAGRVKGLSRLSIELTQLNTSDGQRVKVQTESFSKQGEEGKKGDAAKIGAAAAIGAAIGAIAGGGKGAAIGAGAGGAAGTGGVLVTRGKAAQLPVETKVTFRLRDAVTVTERFRQ